MLLLESSESSDKVLIGNSMSLELATDGGTESTKVAGAMGPPRCCWFTSPTYVVTSATLDLGAAAPLDTRKTVVVSPPLVDRPR